MARRSAELSLLWEYAPIARSSTRDITSLMDGDVWACMSWKVATRNLSRLWATCMRAEPGPDGDVQGYACTHRRSGLASCKYILAAREILFRDK